MRLWSLFLANLRTQMGHHMLEYKSPFSISVICRITALESALCLINHSLLVLCLRTKLPRKKLHLPPQISNF